MGRNVNATIKKLIDIAEKAVDNTDSNVEEKRKRFAKTVNREILNFLLYLSASDGAIEKTDSEFIEKYLDIEMNPREICQKLEEENIYSVSFEQKVPSMLKRVVKYDNSVYMDEGELRESESEKYICLYEDLGYAFITFDDKVSESEKEDLKTYIDNMRGFYAANYEGPKEATEIAHQKFAIKADAVRKSKKDGRNHSKVEGEETLEGLLEELNAMIGLSSVKTAVKRLVYFNAVKKEREDRGFDQIPMTKHMVFYGNPGTGKTTVARLMAKIYHRLGILSKGHLVETDRAQLVAGYVGQTAIKVKEVVEKAKGGVLFIDEAYALTYSRSENDFGWETVDILTKAMEDYRDDLVVIVAGYPKRMHSFIDSNPGFRSRFNSFINFPDYDAEELFDIYKKLMTDAGLEVDDNVLSYTEGFFEEQVANKGENFANARLVRNYIESSIMNQAERIFEEDMNDISDEELCSIDISDVNDIVLHTDNRVEGLRKMGF